MMTSCVVQFLSGKTLSFDVASISTVWHLKRLVKRTIDVPKRRQRLLDGTRELTNHSPLNGSHHRLTLVIVNATCQVCNAETSARRICGVATLHFAAAGHVSATIGNDIETSERIQCSEQLHPRMRLVISGKQRLH